MTKIVIHHGALILLNILCLVQLVILFMAGNAYTADPTTLPGNPTDTIPAIIAIIVIDVIYLIFTRRYGSPERQTGDV